MNNLVAELKRLPPDTPITTGQLASLLEQLLAQATAKTLTSSPDFASLPDNHELTQVEVSKWLRKATGTLENLRLKGTGPAYKPGKPVLYKVGDIKAWLSSRTVSSTSEATMRGIHRLETLADIHPLFNFENELPMGLNDAIDYQELNEATPTSIDLLVFPEVFSMRTTLDKIKPEESEETAYKVLVRIIVNLGEEASTVERLIIDSGEYLVSSGIGINTLVFIGWGNRFNGSLAHMLAWVEQRIDKSTLDRVFPKLAELGLDFEKLNVNEKKPDFYGQDNSYYKQWVEAHKEITLLTANAPKEQAVSKGKKGFKL